VLVPVADDFGQSSETDADRGNANASSLDQRREKDERSDEVDNFHGCPPFSLNPPRKMRSDRSWRSLKRYPAKERAMPKNKGGHGIVVDEKGQEQPKDKNRAQQKPGHMPPQLTKQEESDDAMQPTREKSGF
jgi:hypothetical protein